jgi:hypothetical protein
MNPITGYRDDYEDTSATLGIIPKDSVIAADFNDDNNGHNEDRGVDIENNHFSFGEYDFKRAAFLVNKTYSAFSNPPILPIPLYYDNGARADSIPFMDTTFLHGLSVKVVSFDTTTKVYEVEINYNNFTLKDSQRWCGYIGLTNLTGDTAADIVIQSGVQLTIDRSGTNNRHVETVNTHPKKYFHNFINPTVFDCKPFSGLRLNPSSSLIIKTNSTFRQRPHSKVEVGNNASLTIDSGCTYILDSTSLLLVHNGGKVIIQKYGKLIMDKQVALILNGDNAVLDNRGTLELLDNATFTFTGGNEGLGYVRFFNDDWPVRSNLVAHTNNVFTITGGSFGHRIMEVDGMEGLAIQGSPVLFEVTNGTITMGNNSRINIGTPVHFDAVNVINKNPTDYYRGLHLYGQAGVNIRNSNFTHAYTGIHTIQWYLNTPLSLTNVGFYNCMTGLYTEGRSVKLRNCTFNNSLQRGWNAQAMDFQSRVVNSYGNNNKVNIYHRGAGSSNLIVDSSSFLFHQVTGIDFYGNILSGICNEVLSFPNLYSPNSIILEKNTSFDISPAFHKNAGKWDISGSIIGVSMNYPSRLLLNHSYSNLASSFRALSGWANSVDPSWFKPVIANQNHWDYANNAPLRPTNYLIGIQLSGSIIIYPTLMDSHALHWPVAGPPISFHQYYCGGIGAAGYDSFNHVVVTNHSTTTGSGGTKLDFSVTNNIFTMYDGPLPNYHNIITNFSNILTFPYLTPPFMSPEDSDLLNLAYIKMMEAVGIGVQTGEIQTTSQTMDPALTQVINVQDYLNGMIPLDSAHYPAKFKYVLDKATTYRLAGFRTLANTTLSGLASWANANDIGLVNYWQCQVQKEIQVLTNQMSMDQALNTFNCDPTGMGKRELGLLPVPMPPAQKDVVKATLPSTTEDELLTLYPNPANTELTLTLNSKEASRLSIVLKTVDNKVAIDMVKNIDKRMNSFRLSTATISQGVYILQLQVGNKNYTRQVVIVH